MSEKNIVVLGASCAGLCVAHYFLKQITPILKASDPSSKYRVLIIEPSSHFYWRPASPKAVTDPGVAPTNKLFIPIKDGFKQYDSEDYLIHQGEATAMDTTDRTVTFKSTAPGSDGESHTVSYHTLVICTGIATPTPLTSLHHGDYQKSMEAHKEALKTFDSAKEIVISGGGPVGVEFAGVLGDKYNGSAGFFGSRPASPKVKITLIAGSSDRLLPASNQTRATKAEKLLNKVGVDVMYNATVDNVDKDEKTGKTTVHLSNGGTLTADAYVPGYGATPNSSFVPQSLRTDKGYVKTNGKTFQVENAGPRVYCIGEVQGPPLNGGIAALYDSIPFLMRNVALDLGIEGGKYVGEKTSGNYKEFVNTLGETHVVPIGRTGVGAFKGYSLPGVMIHFFKGKDYMINYASEFTEGTKWKKATW